MKCGAAALYGERFIRRQFGGHRTFTLKRLLSFTLFEFIPRCKQRGIQI